MIKVEITKEDFNKAVVDRELDLTPQEIRDIMRDFSEGKASSSVKRGNNDGTN